MNTLLKFSEKSIVKAAPEQVCSDLNGEAIILNLKSGVYYGLNQTGALIWNLIQEPQTVEALKAALLSEYDVEAEICDRDLKSLLQVFLEQNLIEVIDEANAQTVG
ncbi:MAG: PqqD family protein [Leptolyngbya sp. SIO1D8]|nr:PqqD family protein [Leptolyngbya sp. SIO1D8]